MAYELRLTRSGSPVDPGPQPILKGEVERALSQTGIVLEEPATGEDAWWVRYGPPFSAYKAGELWFRLALVNGVVSMSTSYSNPRVFRNVTDMTSHACWLAGELGAWTIEPGDVAITPSTAKLRICKPGVEENITYEGGLELVGHERPMDDSSPDRVLTAEMLSTLWEDPIWQPSKWTAHYASVARINERPVAAVEVPIGGLDLVPDFAIFRAWSKRPVSIAALEARIQEMGLSISKSEQGLHILSDATGTRPWVAGQDLTKTPAAQAVLRADGEWQVRVNHGDAPWHVIAPAALAAVRAVRDVGGGTTGVVGIQFDESLEREAQDLTARSGVEFFAWGLQQDAPLSYVTAS